MEQHNFSERVLRDMSSAVLVIDSKGYIVYVNNPAAEILEIEAGSQGRLFSAFEANEYNDRFHETVFDALYDKDATMVQKIPFMAPSGKKYILLMTCSFLPGENKERGELVITFTDETAAEEAKRKLNDSSRTFAAFLFGFCIWIIFYAFWEYLNRPFPADIMTHGTEVFGLTMLIYILRNTSFTWRDLGVRSDRPRAALKTALIVSVGCFVFLCALKAVARMIDPTSFEPDAPFIDFSRFGLRQVLYIFTAGIQEFLARSVMQGNLKRIMVGEHAGTMAIVLSSAIFSAMHVHYGFLFMAGAGILAGLEGILYERQQSLHGVWLVHWVFGVSGTLLCLIGH